MWPVLPQVSPLNCQEPVCVAGLPQVSPLNCQEPVCVAGLPSGKPSHLPGTCVCGRSPSGKPSQLPGRGFTACSFPNLSPVTGDAPVLVHNSLNRHRSMAKVVVRPGIVSDLVDPKPLNQHSCERMNENVYMAHTKLAHRTLRVHSCDGGDDVGDSHRGLPTFSQGTKPSTPTAPKGGRGCLMSPSCLESQGCHLIPPFYLFNYFFCLVLLLFLSCHFSANGPFPILCFSPENSNIFR